jgi:two-component system cell cycle response regulator DivK
MGRPEDPEREGREADAGAPEAPEEPKKSDEPEAPEEPDRPEPEKSKDLKKKLETLKKREEPEDPQEPGEPEVPDESGEPDRPEEPGEPDRPEEQLRSLPTPGERPWQLETEEVAVVPLRPGQTADSPSVAEGQEPDDARPLVLCIDADRDNLGMLERVLVTTNRYRVVCFTDGIRGLQAARQERPALILMDLDLPLVDGFEIFRRLRNDPETAPVPVVAVTASVMKGERRRCSEVGFDAFVEKPFDIHELRKLVVGFTSTR